MPFTLRGSGTGPGCCGSCNERATPGLRGKQGVEVGAGRVNCSCPAAFHHPVPSQDTETGRFPEKLPLAWQEDLAPPAALAERRPARAGERARRLRLTLVPGSPGQVCH